MDKKSSILQIDESQHMYSQFKGHPMDEKSVIVEEMDESFAYNEAMMPNQLRHSGLT